MPAAAPPRSVAALAVGESFFTIDLVSREFVRIEAELRAMSAATLIYVESGEWGERVTQADVDRMLEAFDRSTPPESVSPGEGIAAIVESQFGPPTDTDGDGRIHILVLDIRDGYQGGGSFVAGYYASHDQTHLYGSNRRDLLYIDSNPGDAGGDDALATVAHEYQHLVHHAGDRDEAVFVNEGLSEYATAMCGYGLRRFTSYLGATDVPLDSWSNREADYERVLLWTLYLAEQLGLPFLSALFAEPANGVAGIENALATVAASRTFPELLADWFTANAINDREVDPRLGYRTPIDGTATANRQHFDYPVNRSTDVSQLACDVMSFHNVEGLSLRVEGPGASARVVRRGLAAGTVVSELPLGQAFASPDLGISHDEVLLIVSSLTRFGADYSYTATANAGRVRELAYDDGEADEVGILSPAADRGLAVRFTPEVHNARLRSAAIVLGDTCAFELCILDDNGPGGRPGSDLITPVRVEPRTAFGFQRVDLRPFELEVTSGDFYVGVIGLPGSTLTVGLDLTPPIDGRGYLFDQGAWQAFDDIGLGDVDLMFRARVEYDDTVPPELAIGLLQHPVFSEEADLYLTSDKALLGPSLSGVMRLGDQVDTLRLLSVNEEGRTFVDDSVRLAVDGEGEVEIEAMSRYGALASRAVLRFVVRRVGMGGGELRLATDGGGASVVLAIPEGALTVSTAITLQPGAAAPGGPPGPPRSGAQILTVGPRSLALDRPAELIVSAEGGDPTAALVRWGGGGWEPVPARMIGGQLRAPLDRLGTLALVPGELPLAPPQGLRLIRITPHPVRDLGALTVEVAESGPVEVRIYDMSGRLRTVVAGDGVAAGRRSLPLDLRPLASGSYIVEVTSGGARCRGKLVRVR
jgi:hypothetical protein